jgi:hypothetical protein
MRVLHAATLVAAAAVLSGSVASAQGLAEAAAREKEKRKGKTGSAKVITEEDLRKAGGSSANIPVASSDTADAKADPNAKPDAAKPAAKGDEKSEEQIKAEQAAAWKKKLEQAQKEATVYEDLIKALQLSLNDTSGGVYTPRRAAEQARLEGAQKSLADTRQKVADLEAEGRQKGY